MDGLETLVAPTHHAFLLTESAAAAHFNVLSFDTCLFKPSSSFAAAHHPQLQHLNLHATTTSISHSTETGATTEACSNNSSSNSSCATESNGSNRMANSLGGGPTITILDNGTGSSGSALSHSKGAGNEVEAAQGDLNTPVTTANDLPSFFGPSVVVEPPPITGEFHR